MGRQRPPPMEPMPAALLLVGLAATVRGRIDPPRRTGGLLLLRGLRAPVVGGEPGILGALPLVVGSPTRLFAITYRVSARMNPQSSQDVSALRESAGPGPGARPRPSSGRSRAGRDVPCGGQAVAAERPLPLPEAEQRALDRLPVVAPGAGRRARRRARAPWPRTRRARRPGPAGRRPLGRRRRCAPPSATAGPPGATSRSRACGLRLRSPRPAPASPARRRAKRRRAGSAACSASSSRPKRCAEPRREQDAVGRLREQFGGLLRGHEVVVDPQARAIPDRGAAEARLCRERRGQPAAVDVTVVDELRAGGTPLLHEAPAAAGPAPDRPGSAARSSACPRGSTSRARPSPRPPPA